MFTGIVEDVGEVVAVQDLPDASRLTIAGAVGAAGAQHGESISVDGVCLTVVSTTLAEDGRPAFTTDVMRETLIRSALAKVSPGDAVNLERAARLDSRLGGHLVQGHVDGTGLIVSREPSEHWELVRIGLPTGLERYVVEKGSITVSGVSLTVVEVDPPGTPQPTFTVSLIPTTLADTTLGGLHPGDPVNLEVDIVAKYVERLLGSRVVTGIDTSDTSDTSAVAGEVATA